MKVQPSPESNFYMDGYLKKALDIYVKAVQKDWDFLLIIDGLVGSGKSVLAMQIAKYLDPKFTIEQIVFSSWEFRRKLIEIPKGSVLIFDEAILGLNNRDAMMFLQRELIKLLTMARQRNLFIILVIPTFFDLDRTIPLSRARALLHVYDKNFERGFFLFFKRPRMKQLYINGVKYHSYSLPKASSYGRFTNYYPIKEREYRERKLQHLLKRTEEVKEAATLAMVRKQLDCMYYILNNEFGLNSLRLADKLSQNGLSGSDRTIRDAIARHAQFLASGSGINHTILNTLLEEEENPQKSPQQVKIKEPTKAEPQEQ